MIAPDANLLIYANSPTSPSYRESRRWLENILSSSELVGIPILSIYAFLRFVTNRKIAPTALTFSYASEVINVWLALPHVRILYPSERHWQLVQQISQNLRPTGNLVTDASLAAIALEYGAVIYTADHHFARFAGIRWHNPLA